MNNGRAIQSAARRGFTLIELLVVIVILAILAAVVIQRVTHRTEDARISKAMTDARALDEAIETYKLDTGTYPTADEGLEVLLVKGAGPTGKGAGPYLKNGLPKDPWGNPYIYRNPGERGDFDVFSAGPDGQPGTADDIGNWQG